MATLLFLFLCLGCAPVTTENPLPAAQSLLLVDPLVGGESESSENEVNPTRLTLNEISVEGWLIPAGGSLRFPLVIEPAAKLSFVLGAVTTESRAVTECRIRLSWMAAEDQEGGNETPGVETVLLDTAPVDNPEMMEDWVPFNVELPEAVRGSGELVIAIEGNQALDPGIFIMFGEPAVYYPEKMRHRNVLLIGIDTLRHDALSIYGGRPEITPNISRLAEHGTVFERSWGQAPFTGVSFASMMTGLWPADITATITTVQVPSQVTTIAERLLGAGFATRMVCGNPYLGTSWSGFQHGMEAQYYRSDAHPAISAEIAENFIDNCSDRDWFMFLHIMDPHSPYEPPRNLVDSLCTPGYRGPYEDYFNDGATWEFLKSPQESPERIEIDRVRELYEAEVADVDNAVGEIYSYLERNDLLKDTLVILTADHGEEFFEHNMWGHGQNLYNEITNLPMIVWGPGFAENQRIDSVVANVDIVPTILEFLGQPVPDNLAGIPLQDTVEAPTGNRIVFGEGNLRRGPHQKYALEWPYKCTLDFYTGETRLYDLLSDPAELIDISGTTQANADIAQRLSVEMVRNLVPMHTIFFVAIIGDPQGGPQRFTGTVRIPDGIAYVTSTGKIQDDDFTWDDNTVQFDFSAAILGADPKKALLIYPATSAETVEMSMLTDGQVDPARFYPYASDRAEPSGSATIEIYDLPWPNRIPTDAFERPVACYVLCIPGFPRDDTPFQYEQVELDLETKEQLRALGYINPAP